MTTSKFISDGKSFIEEAANYLHERGLTIQQLPIESYRHIDLGFYIKRKGTSEMFEPFVLEGWAFKVRRPDGEYYDDRWLLRVCNWPKEQLYQRRGGRICIVAGTPPKFVQISPKGADLTNFISPINDFCQSKLVMFHEKFTSAALATKLLGVPSIALSGCTNWSENGKVKDSIIKVIEGLELHATLVVCFDGDILNNPNVMYAASQLKGWIYSMRKDVRVIFPAVPDMPEGKNGWDDWVVMQGDKAKDAWTDILAGDGVQVLTGLPIQYLIQEFQVKAKVLKDKIAIEHTAANYARLLRHPTWCNYAMDTLGQIYNTENMEAGSISMDDLYRRYEMWLADTVFQGDGAGVRSTQVKEAVREVMRNREQSIANYVLSTLPEVTEDQALSAAIRLITEGIKVTGPMTEQETAITMIRVFRDMVKMWTNEESVDCQWALVLIGPSGCGKSNFPISVVRALDRLGYESWPAQLAKTGGRASIDELMRQCRDSHVGVFDEYNPDDKDARQVEQNLFTLTSSRKFAQRKLHEESSTRQLRHASIFLTTVDKNNKFIRSGKGAGERRFIVLNVEGVRRGPDGKLTSDREVITECATLLLRYGLQLHLNDDNQGSATEYAIVHTDQYLSDSPIEARLAQVWSKRGMLEYMKAFRERFERESTGDIRWAPPHMHAFLADGDERLSRQDRADLNNIIVECGAEDIGQGRINGPDGDIKKDKVYSVKSEDWGAFVEAMRSRFG